MTENKSQNKIDRIRKVIARKKAKYELPTDDDLILDNEDIEYQNERTDNWLESFTGKNQYDITENLCVNW